MILVNRIFCPANTHNNINLRDEGHLKSLIQSSSQWVSTSMMMESLHWHTRHTTVAPAEQKQIGIKEFKTWYH